MDDEALPRLLQGTDVAALEALIPLQPLLHRYLAWLMPREVRWQPERKIPPHTFEPLGQPHELVRSLISVDPGPHRDTWIALLKLASEHHRGALTRALNDLPAARRRPVLALLGS